REQNEGKVYDTLAQCAAGMPDRLEFDPPGEEGEFLLKLLEKRLAADTAAGWYRAPNVPPKKRTNALTRDAAGRKEEKVLGRADETALGSAKDGFVLCTAGVHYHLSSRAGGFIWAEVLAAVVKKGVITTSVEVTLTDGRKHGLECALSKKIAQPLADLINQMA